jgi:TolB protein
MDITSGKPKQLTHYPEDDTTAEWYAYKAGPPIWEANRNIITYASKQNGNYSIFSINPDGTELTQITPDSTDELYHSWSPEGDWIVFDGVQDEDNYDIFIMNYNNKEIKRLTNDSKYEQGPVFVKQN